MPFLQRPRSLASRASEASRRIYALLEHLQSNRCEDPSTPSENLRFSSVAQDDIVFGVLQSILQHAHYFLSISHTALPSHRRTR